MHKQIYLIIKTFLLFIFWFLFFVLTVLVLEELVGLFFNIEYFSLWYSSLGQKINRFIPITSLGIVYFSSKKFKPKYLSFKAFNISWLIILGFFISTTFYFFINPLPPMKPWDSQHFPQYEGELPSQEELNIELIPFEDL